MFTRSTPLLALTAAALLLGAAPAAAQDEEQTYARSYVMTPRAGMAMQFEAALREHAQWRKANGDPWQWTVMMANTGQQLGQYTIRSGGHTLQDFDAYDAGFGQQGLMHWNATVAPLVESAASLLTTIDWSISKAFEGTWNMVSITRYHVRPGRGGQFNALVRQAHENLVDAMDGNWLWSSPVSGGEPGPYVDLVVLLESYADMADPDPSFEEIMMEAIGEDAFREWGESFGQTFRGVESYMMTRRPDLSVLP